MKRLIAALSILCASLTASTPASAFNGCPWSYQPVRATWNGYGYSYYTRYGGAYVSRSRMQVTVTAPGLDDIVLLTVKTAYSTRTTYPNDGIVTTYTMYPITSVFACVTTWQ